MPGRVIEDHRLGARLDEASFKGRMMLGISF
jgi:hypothetical protein